MKEIINKITEEAILVGFAIRNDLISLDLDPEVINYEDLQNFYKDELGPYKLKVLFN